MQVTDENVVKSRELESHASHFELGTLTAVNHHEMPTHINHLARWQVPQCGCCRATSQYVQV